MKAKTINEKVLIYFLAMFKLRLLNQSSKYPLRKITFDSKDIKIKTPSELNFIILKQLTIKYYLYLKT